MLTKLNDFSWSQIDYHIEFLVYLNNYKDDYSKLLKLVIKLVISDRWWCNGL